MEVTEIIIIAYNFPIKGFQSTWTVHEPCGARTTLSYLILANAIIHTNCYRKYDNRYKKKRKMAYQIPVAYDSYENN